MHSLSRFFFTALAVVVLPACAYKTEERLEALEAKARDQQLFDLRVSNLEGRVSEVETAVGQLRDAAAKPGSGKGPRVVKPEARRSQERLPATPVAVRTVDVNTLPDSKVPYLPEANVAGGRPVPAPVVVLTPAPATAQTTTVSPAPAPAVTVVSDPAAPGLVAVPLVAEPPKVQDKGGAVKPRPASSQADGVPANTGSSGYNAALALYNKGNFEKARQAFADFLGRSPSSPLAPNALYWQGECLYSTGKYDQAIMLFQEVSTKYPKHAKAAASLLKIGYSYERLKDMQNARFYWQILVDDFPSSSPAAMARKRLNAA